jgi:N-acetylglucosamine-6-sulfatase
MMNHNSLLKLKMACFICLSIFLLAMFLIVSRAQVIDEDVSTSLESSQIFEISPDELEGVYVPSLIVKLRLAKQENAKGQTERLGRASFYWTSPGVAFEGSSLMGIATVRLLRVSDLTTLTEVIQAPIESNSRLYSMIGNTDYEINTPATDASGGICVELSLWDLVTTDGFAFKQTQPFLYCPSIQTDVPDLSVKLEPSSASSVVLASAASIVIAAQNLGPISASHPKIEISLPSNLSFLGDNSEEFDCGEIATRRVRCVQAVPGPFLPQSVGISISVRGHRLGNGDISLTISSDTDDPDTKNNTVELPFSVVPAPPITSLELVSNDLNITENDTIILSAQADGMALVEFYEDTTLLQVVENPNLNLFFHPNHEIAVTELDNGVHTYSAKAFDAKGEELSSIPIGINVTIGNQQQCTSLNSLPNMIVIVSDDQNYSELEYMPHTKRYLVDQGTVFTQAFVPNANCCPSRASILRGQYPHNHQVLTSRYPYGGYGRFYELGHEASTIATWLQEANYYTGYIGKYLNQYPSTSLNTLLDETYIPPGWNEWFATSSQDYYNYQINKNGFSRTYGLAEEDYATDRYGQIAAGFVQRNACKNQPFFLFFSPTAPHLPAVPANRHQTLFANVQVPRSPSFNEADISDKPTWMQRLPLLTTMQIAEVDELYRNRLRMLQSLDEAIKHLVDTLEAKGVLNNTVILFTSDNGYKLGQHRLQGKIFPYEEDIKVPLIIRGPNILQQEISNLVVNIDIAPTLAELANITPPSFVDGQSLVPFLSGAPSPWRQAVLDQYWVPQTLQLEHSAVRTDRYKYIEWYTESNGRLLDATQYELYDLQEDPYEVNNIYDTASQELKNSLKTKLDYLKSCQGQNCNQVP